MDEDDADAIAKLRQTRPECLIMVMIDVRADMLERGDHPDEVAHVLDRMCNLLGVDPAKLRRAMN